MANVHAVDLALLVFRVAIGAVFIAHGVNHIIGGGKIAGTGRWFESLGMKPGWFHAWTASITEIGAGLLLVLGLLTAFGRGRCGRGHGRGLGHQPPAERVLHLPPR